MQAARPAAAARRHLDPVRPDEARRARDPRDRHPLEPFGHVRARRLLHRPLVAQEVGDARRAAQRQIDAVQLAAAEARQRERRLAQRLARHRAGVDERAAEIARALDQRYRLPEERGRDRAGDPRRPRADHDQVEPFPLLHRLPPRAAGEHRKRRPAGPRSRRVGFSRGPAAPASGPRHLSQSLPGPARRLRPPRQRLGAPERSRPPRTALPLPPSPPLAHHRVQLRADGRLLVDLKTVWRDGTSHLLVMGRAVCDWIGWKR